jgi:hypothetical protein
MQYETITGTQAINRMRNLRLVNDATFTLIHISCKLTTGECGTIVKHERCRLRKSLPDKRFKTADSDHYLTYEDVDTGEPKMCFKILIRFVAFPPDYRLLKVTWFE